MRTFILTIALCLSSAAFAQQHASVAAYAFDVIASPKEYAGKRVKIYGCKLYGATAQSTLCAAFSKNGEQIGNIVLDAETMSKEQRIKLINECAGNNERTSCNNKIVTGRVNNIYGLYVRVTKVEVDW
jgi:hypothetical protein